jgi:hypothetical protein
MTDQITEQALYDRICKLKKRVNKLMGLDTFSLSGKRKLEKQYIRIRQSLRKFDKDPFQVETEIDEFEMYIIRLETPLSLSEKQAEKAWIASKVMLGISVGAWLLLIGTNIISMFALPELYGWPNGWFIQMDYLGFALAGVTINILLSLMPRVWRGDWNKKYLGAYFFRALQATVYGAVVYHFIKYLSEQNGEVDQIAGIPLAVSALFVGMFVTLLEGAFAGIGERFVDMLSTLFASKFAGPSQKAAINQDMRQKRAQLISRYSEMDKSSIRESQRKKIDELFNDALLLIQSVENDQAELKLQEIELMLESFKQPLVEITRVHPAKAVQSEGISNVIITGKGFQGGATIRLQKDDDILDAQDVTVISETKIQCSFSVQEARAGTWDVIVVDPLLKESKLENGFQIVDSPEDTNSDTAIVD